jgi:hypothetical protein
MVSAANSRLRIARELLPRAGGADLARTRWSPRAPVGAHAAVMERAPMAAAAATPGGPGGSRACHNCGELGHCKNGCPHPRRNSSGGGQGGRGQNGSGGRGWGKTQRACFVCGDLTHLAGQCPKRVMPAPAAAAINVGGGEMRSVGATDYQAFEEWRAMTPAAAMEAEGSDEEGEWDDQDYALGAVALPLEGAQVQLAAAGTKAGAAKAKATRAAAGGVPRGGVLGPAAGRPVGGIGTVSLAGA